MTRSAPVRPAHSGQWSASVFRDPQQERLVELDALVVRIERQVADARLDEVLEEVGAERHVGDVVALLPGDLDEHGRVVDLRVGDADAELDVAAAAPASRAHEDELAPRQELVELADGLADGDEVAEFGQLAVAVRVDIDDVGDVGDAAVRDVLAGREQDGRVREVRPGSPWPRPRPPGSAAGTAGGRSPCPSRRTRCRPGRPIAVDRVFRMASSWSMNGRAA